MIDVKYINLLYICHLYCTKELAKKLNLSNIAKGKVSLAYSTFLGYDKGDDGKLKVNEEQAETIKIIFRLYMIGYSAYHIKEKLEELKIKTPFGKTKWHVSTMQ